MIKKIADYLGTSSEVVIITFIALIVAFVIVYIKITIDEKKGSDSKEKADIRKLIDAVVPNGKEYVAAYAHGKEVYRSRNMKREVYHYYAIAFKESEPNHMWVIPISVDAGKINYTEPMRMSAENLSYIGGDWYHLDLHYSGEKVPYTIIVDESNTKMGKECQVNIQQPEAAASFKNFSVAFQANVNETLGVDKKGKKIKM